MPGIYIHIPFCRQACRYCDFYFTVSLSFLDDFVVALQKEIYERQEYIGKPEIETVYFGGGTPSVLKEGQLFTLMETIHSVYHVSENAEITFEANPDDLTPEYLKMLKKAGFNRLSIGIQSFRETDLQLMRRSHNAEQARACLSAAADEGFTNVNMDLIYGIPGLSIHDWETNVKEAASLPVTHISAYHLTYESGTVFDHWRKKGRLKEISEDDSVEQYMLLRRILAAERFNHYEISNFAREGFRSRHNSMYWKGEPYAGFGPSAHSFNGTTRQWNIPSVKRYMEALREGTAYSETEVLSPRDRYHDYLITSLRTAEGICMKEAEKTFGQEIFHHLASTSTNFISSEEMIKEGTQLRISPEGWLRADMIISRLMLPDQE